MFDTLDVGVQAHLGRSLRDLAFDYRTALFLKSYNDAGDARWRLDWVGNLNAAVPLESQKPFPIPPALYGEEPDDLSRARRLLDPFGTCSPSASPEVAPKCVVSATPSYFQAGDFVASGPHGLDPFGEGLLSIALSPAFADASVGVALVAPLGEAPRVRVFRAPTLCSHARPRARLRAAPLQRVHLAASCRWRATRQRRGPGRRRHA